MELSRKFSLNNVGWAIGFAVLLFLMCLEGMTDIALLKKVFKHLDEILVLFGLVYIILHIYFIFKKKRALLFLWIAFMAIGAVSGVTFRYQGILPSLVDAVTVISKFMVGYFVAFIYASLHENKVSSRIKGAARWITVFLFVIALHDMVLTPWFPKGDFRYFTNSLILMFPHQTYLAAAAATLLVLLGYTNKSNQNIPHMLMASFVGFMTLRGKAIAFFLVYWVLYISILIFRNRHYLAMMVGGGIGCVIIAFEQISDYFLTSTRYSPRQILLQDSISLALEHFPLGTGFGTFGSTIAQQYYSPLYVQLGYTKLHGMGPTDAMFLTDSFWPEILAQFGLIGTVLFIAVLGCLLISCLQKLSRKPLSGFTMLAIMVNMLINSMAESSFFNPTSFLLFAIFGLCEAEEKC